MNAPGPASDVGQASRAHVCFDVCNGDADGLCALLQWRLSHPVAATLVTAPKRDIALLQRVHARAGDEVLVCDLSMQRNLADLQRLLDAGVRVTYFDHHLVDAVPQHPGLQARIDASSDICTSLLVDRELGGAWRPWALVGAYGDNLAVVADRLASASGIDEGDRRTLRRLGEAINYNAYGERESDLHIAPADLYVRMSRHTDPREMWLRDPIGRELDDLRQADLARAIAVPPLHEGARGTVVVLPDEPWARRASGSLANDLAAASPGRAHAVLKDDGCGGYTVSVRAPWCSPAGAADLCAAFGGGGRAGAAGIEGLPRARLGEFVQAFERCRWGGSTADMH